MRLYTFVICGNRNWSAKRQSPAYWRGPPPSLDQMNIIICISLCLLLGMRCCSTIGSTYVDRRAFPRDLRNPHGAWLLAGEELWGGGGFLRTNSSVENSALMLAV